MRRSSHLPAAFSSALWQVMMRELVPSTVSGTAPKRSCRYACVISTARVPCRVMLCGPKAGGTPSHELSAAIRAPIVAFCTPGEAAMHWRTVWAPSRPPTFWATHPRISFEAARVTFRMPLLMALSCSGRSKLAVRIPPSRVSSIASYRFRSTIGSTTYQVLEVPRSATPTPPARPAEATK